MTSSSMPKQEHRRSPSETVAMASDEPQPQLLPGLGNPAGGRSGAVTKTMAAGGAGGQEEEAMGAEGRRLDDVVLAVGRPSGKLLPAPTPLSSVKQELEEEVSAPLGPLHPENFPAPLHRDAAVEDPSGSDGARRGLLQRLQDRAQAGRGAAGAGGQPVRRRRSFPNLRRRTEGWISAAAYLLGREKSPSPTTEAAPPAPAPEKKKRKRKPWYPRQSPAKKCHHCQSTSTPQWRMGPTGPSTLCNACGVRYMQGRLLEEYRPAASPSFTPSEHAYKHREVLQLRKKNNKKKQRGKWHHQRPQPAAMQPPRAGDGMELAEQQLPLLPEQAHAGGDELPTGEPISLDKSLLDAIDESPETHTMLGVGDDLQMGGPSSLDQFPFDGPAAPPLVDDDDEDLAED